MCLQDILSRSLDDTKDLVLACPPAGGKRRLTGLLGISGLPVHSLCPETGQDELRSHSLPRGQVCGAQRGPLTTPQTSGRAGGSRHGGQRALRASSRLPVQLAVLLLPVATPYLGSFPLVSSEHLFTDGHFFRLDTRNSQH